MVSPSPTVDQMAVRRYPSQVCRHILCLMVLCGAVDVRIGQDGAADLPYAGRRFTSGTSLHPLLPPEPGGRLEHQAQSTANRRVARVLATAWTMLSRL